MHVELIFAATTVPLSAFALTRKFSVVPGQLIDSLYPQQLAGLDDLIDTETDAGVLWRASHGFMGLWRRYRNHITLVRLCQLQAEADKEVTPYELTYTLRRALVLARASRRAALWGMFRWILPKRHAKNVHKALKLYREIAYQTRILFEDGTAYLSGEQLASVL